MNLNDFIASSDKIDMANYPEGLSIYNHNGKQYGVPRTMTPSDYGITDNV